jgi:GNAT superfamily N-acetyltransferase
MVIKLEAKKIFEGELPSIKGLFKSCNWDWLESDSQMEQAFKNSYNLYFAYDGESLIGFGRLLSDGLIYALLVDVMFSPQFQSKGYGTQLVKFIMDDAKKNGVKVIQLLSFKPINI